MFLDDVRTITHVQAYNTEHLNRYVFTGVSTDSRSVRDGEVFIALRGEQFDGHAFIEHVFSKGIPLCIVDKKWFKEFGLRYSTGSFIIVEHTTIALGELANIWRKKFDIPIITITGSNGKTTTKEMLTQVLQNTYNVHATRANDNNHIGVPQTLFGICKQHDIAVLELGSNHIGEIAYLNTIAEPTHALVTNIGREHLEFFGSVENIAKEETTTFTKPVFGFVNDDDGEIKKYSPVLQKKKTYGFNSYSDVQGNIEEINDDGCVRFSVSAKNGTMKNVQLGIAGTHNAINALAAATVGLHFGVPLEYIRTSLELFRAYDKRMQIEKVNGITIINDTYNANPDSVIASLQTLAAMKTTGKKIIVLADMFELGSRSEPEHILIGTAIASMKFQHLFTFGRFAELISKTSMLKTARHFTDKQKLISTLQEQCAPNDIILVKGSRGMKMEEVVNALRVWNN